MLNPDAGVDDRNIDDRNNETHDDDTEIILELVETPSSQGTSNITKKMKQASIKDFFTK